MHITVRLHLDHRLGWLAAGIALGTLPVSDLVRQAADLLLRCAGHR